VNPGLQSSLSIVNKVISNQQGLLSFGNIDRSTSISSASSTRGSGFLIEAAKISQILEGADCQDPCIVKIDIEGSELKVADQIADLSNLDAAIYLAFTHHLG